MSGVDPEAEVIALSPKTLLATNRFVCEICNKGFQRDQNLQLHRRGHNLPWKLRQRTGKEVRKRVYVCPEPSCVHHDPSRALGDLTGIKKHFCRKHGEKKWKCDKCSKKYAVQSDWKAHSKVCGTREYRCDCGTLFSRAFCDALAEESAKTVAKPPAEDGKAAATQDGAAVAAGQDATVATAETAPAAVMVAALPPQQVTPLDRQGHSTATLSDLMGAMGQVDRSFAEPPSLCLATNGRPAPLFSPQAQARDRRPFAPPPSSPHMSATALLQKAAQMGSAATGSSFLRGFGLDAAPSGQQQEGLQDSGLRWGHHHHARQQQSETEPSPMLSAGLGLGLPYEPDLMMASSQLFGPKPATLDFLGLGMGPVGGAPNGGLSALMTSIGGGGGGLNMGPGTATGGRVGAERKPNSPAIR
ncbi:hypothetical protein B296_00009139 [Ensete ventricosum]|uniref:C2H2-type domain-containing protein n=1 Tax=Ensete ventricosum TaxID=4639 RepID=A0A426ZYD8_ENSVE|nr:hypothetical protein B296_00009139 [Ensete ventricosum]